MRRLSIMVGMVFLSGCTPTVSTPVLTACASGEPNICCRGPGVPTGSGFGLCIQPRFSSVLSTAQSPHSIRFALTPSHAVWWDHMPAPESNSLFYAEHAGRCGAAPGPTTRIAGTEASDGQDTMPIAPGRSLVYYDVSGGDRPLHAMSLPDLRPLSPLPAAAVNQSQPGASADGSGFAWVEGNDIWACRGASCDLLSTIRVTNSADVKRRPRMFGSRVVWENQTTGRIEYADLALSGFTPRSVDQGVQPDINADWIVYAKAEPRPHAHCHWVSHQQIWAFGPLSGIPTVMRIQATPYWGAGQYIWPRLTSRHVVFLVNYMYATKTVVGIYPITAFGSAVTPFREMDDMADGYSTDANVAAWEQRDGAVHAIYMNTAKRAKLTCCAGH